MDSFPEIGDAMSSLTDAANGQPNVLVIMSDEHAPMFSSAYGHPIVSTPGMDRLAEEGVTFSAAYCNSPLCVPSRMSFMTGRFPSRVGVFDNASPLRSDVPTWAHLAKAAGYDVALAGKMHFVGPDQLHGFDCQLARDLHSERRHGIADWTIGVPPSSEPWPELLRAGPGRGVHITADDEVEEAAVAWLRDRSRRGRPWVLCASFLAPHFPLVVPESYWSRYPVDEIDLPLAPSDSSESQHPVIKSMRAMLGFGDHSEEATRRGRAAYYGLVSYLDDKISRLLDTLDATGQAENTLVIYISDHGEMAGEHGMWRKSNFYEQSARVPLQLRWPGALPGGTWIGHVVSLVDLVASLASVFGTPAVMPLDGDDLVPLAQGRSQDWKDEAFAEYNAHGVSRPAAMIRQGQYKLNQYLGNEPELYDLHKDPGEFNDLGNHPDFAVTRDEMRSRLFELWDADLIEKDVLQSQRERHLILRSAGWTSGISAGESRETAHIDRSLVDPTDHRKDKRDVARLDGVRGKESW